jgi:hypothetical protein
MEAFTEITSGCLECKLHYAFGGVVIMGLKFYCEGNNMLIVERVPINTQNSIEEKNIVRAVCKNDFEDIIQKLDKTPIDDIFP